MPTAEAGTFSLLTMKNKVQTIFYLSIAAAILVGVLSAFFIGGNGGLDFSMESAQLDENQSGLSGAQ